MIAIDKCTESIEIERVNTCSCDGDYYLVLQNTATRETYAGELLVLDENTLRTKFQFSPSEDMCPGTYEYYLVCGECDWSQLFKEDIKCSTFTRFLTDCKLLAFGCKLLVDGTPTRLNIVARGLLQYCDNVNNHIIKSKRKFDGFKV